MTTTSRLYDALNDYLGQYQDLWKDIRHLQTLCWMMVGILQSQSVNLSQFGVHIDSSARFAQSHQRRFRRGLSNRRINVLSVHHQLLTQAMAGWEPERLYLSLDTTILWNEFCLVWVGLLIGDAVFRCHGDWSSNRVQRFAYGLSNASYVRLSAQC